MRGLKPRIEGRRVISLEVIAPLVVRSPLDAVCGCVVEEVRRHGKFVVLQCGGGLLSIHLGMTGKLLVDAPRTPYTRVVFHLDEGALLYDDIRQFGRLEWQPARLAELGPDALEIGETEFAAGLRASRSRVKPLLLNQRFVRGLGNIYVDEALFRAGVHPKAMAARLSRARARALHAAIGQVLREAIEHRGSSISDYVDASGERGGFQRLHRVYGRKGLPCVTCGTPVRRTVVAQRGTHFCPHCQRG